VGATSDGGGSSVTPLAAGEAGTVVLSMAQGYHAHLYAVGADGRRLRRLTRGDESELAPDVSRDGRIVYQAKPHGNSDLFLLAGGRTQQLTRDSADDGEPAWSPDGRRIAFVRDGDLYVMAADGSGVRKLADDAEWPAWAPSRHELAFSSDRDGDYDVYAIADAGTSSVRMTTDPHDDRRPVWSPDGARVVFESDRSGPWHLYALRAGSGGVVALTHGSANDFAPAWSRDGRRLVFLSDRDGNDQLFVARADGSRVRRLTSGQADKDTPVWLR
jgi:Tol biopolymer transport system component